MMTSKTSSQVNGQITSLKDFTEWYIDTKKIISRVNEITRTIDISFDQYIILAQLRQNSGLTTSTISKALKTSAAAASRKISLLQSKKLIEKVYCESEDQRRVALSLTPEALIVLDRIEGILYSYLLEEKDLIETMPAEIFTS